MVPVIGCLKSQMFTVKVVEQPQNTTDTYNAQLKKDVGH